MKAQFGLLLPRSVLYPSIGFDILAGARAALSGAGENPETIWPENIGLGTDYNQIYAVCERMLMQGATLVAAYINPLMAVQLQPLFAASYATLLVLDSGYHFSPLSAEPNIFFLSLQGALCSRVATAMAVDAGHRSFLFATSFYDAGYRTIYAMGRAVQAANGAVLTTYVAPLRRDEFSLQSLSPLFGHPDAPVVLASYCGDMAADFLGHLAGCTQKPNALFASPFMAEETWLSRCAYPGMTYTAVVPWSRDLNAQANASLAAGMNGRPTSVFSVLGYEAGLIYNVLTAAGARGDDAAAELRSQPFPSPRGPLRFDPATHQTLAQLYSVVVGRGEDTDRCAILETVRYSEEHTAKQRHLLQEDIAAISPHADTWVNTYPCIDS